MWEPTRDGMIRCTDHDLVFAKGTQTCPLCDGGSVTDAPPAERPRYLDATALPSVIEHEAWCCDVSDRLRDLAEQMVTSEQPSMALVAKLYDTALKARRVAWESARHREDWVATRWLEDQVKALRRARDGRGSNKPEHCD